MIMYNAFSGTRISHEKILHILDRVYCAVRNRFPQNSIPHECWLCYRTNFVPW